MENDRFVLRSMTDEIMYEIMQLSGQEYSDMYANKAKKLIAAKKAEAAEATSADDTSAAPADAQSDTNSVASQQYRAPGNRVVAVPFGPSWRVNNGIFRLRFRYESCNEAVECGCVCLLRRDLADVLRFDDGGG